MVPSIQKKRKYKRLFFNISTPFRLCPNNLSLNIYWCKIDIFHISCFIALFFLIDRVLERGTCFYFKLVKMNTSNEAKTSSKKDFLYALIFLCFFSLVTPCLVVAVHPCMECIPIFSKKQAPFKRFLDKCIFCIFCIICHNYSLYQKFLQKCSYKI